MRELNEKQMKGLVFTEPNKVKLMNVPKPTIDRNTDVIVKIILTTICGSDLHLVHGALPTTPGYVLGHEYVGVIEEVGDSVKSFSVGDRVIGSPAVYCGQCQHCQEGHFAQCLNGGIHGSGKEFGDINGTHAEYMRVPFADTTLLKVPNSVTDEEAIFISDILTTGYHAINKANTKPGDTVVIFGAGPVGLSAVVSAKLFSPKDIILIGSKNQFRLDIGKELGATYTLRSVDVDPVKEVAKITKGKGAEVVVDASGAESAIQQACRCASIEGNVSLVGIGGKDVSIPMAEVFTKNININMGLSHLGYKKTLLELVESRKIDLSPIITHRYRLDEMEEAFETFEKGKDNSIKVLVRP